MSHGHPNLVACYLLTHLHPPVLLSRSVGIMSLSSLADDSVSCIGMPFPRFLYGARKEEAPERPTPWDYAVCATSMHATKSSSSVNIYLTICPTGSELANSVAWPGDRIIADPQFDFNASLQVSIARENDLRRALFSLSPLSSPASTPPSSPGPTSHQPLQTDVEEFRPQSGPSHTKVTTPSDTASMNYPQTPSATGTSKRKAKLKRTSKTRRDRGRANKKASKSFAAYKTTSRLISRHVDSSHQITCDTAASELKNIASTGFVGLDDGSRSKVVYKLEDLVGDQSRFRFQLHRWCGGYVRFASQT